ncbi:hypothetical protein GF343_04120 [Candidatus Woesearchaeota archaeon]|nr:hypothetical protein [Candidatus Woesearchaeota archaeon]
MDGYIARLERFLGKEHKSTQGFTIIKDLIQKGDAPLMGVFYAGKTLVSHDLVLYSIGENIINFEPVPRDSSLANCLKSAQDIAATIQNPPRDPSHLIVLAMDQAAVEQLYDAQAELNKDSAAINGRRITYVSVPLSEQITAYEKPEAESALPDEPLSLQGEAIRQGMLARSKKAADKDIPAKTIDIDTLTRRSSAP